MKMKETDLSAKVVEWLQDQRWEVYQEVKFGGWAYGQRCADIVAVNGPIMWIIECKTSCSLAVIEQAHRWIRTANMVSIAVPKQNNFSEHVCRAFGIGIISLCKHVCDIGVSENVRPKLWRFSTKRYRDKLEPEHKTFAKAGTSSGKSWTPFTRTCREVLNAVNRQPGLSIKDLIKGIDHHYNTASTARASLKLWIEKGKVPGVRMERDGRFLRVYPS